MKKLIGILCFFIISFTFVIGSEAITSGDVIKEAPLGTNRSIYDVNGDGRVTALDALILLQREARKNREVEIEYKYDELNRLIQWSSNKYCCNYSYDPNGNCVRIEITEK